MDKRIGEKSTQAHQIDLSSGNHCFLGVFWRSFISWVLLYYSYTLLRQSLLAIFGGKILD